MRSVVDTDSGLVAVGEDSTHAAVWTSLDGTTWSKVPHQDDIFCGDHVCSMASVAVSGTGLIAVGHDAAGITDLASGVWTSADGHAWTRQTLETEPLRDVTLAGTSLLAVGSEAGFRGDRLVWISHVGSDWSIVADTAGVLRGEEYQAMRGIAADNDRVVAVGVKSGTTAIWTTEVSN